MLSELLFEATERDPLYVASTLRWVAESARDPRGRARAWHDLARLFQVGRGVARSASEALRCHRAAAALGHGGSAVALGTALRLDDPEAALGWLRRALSAEYGAKPDDLDRARLQVGQIWYMRPDLVPDDELEACLRAAAAPQAAVFLSLWLERRGRPDEAERVLDEAAARTDDPGVHAQRAVSVAPRRPERLPELLRGPRAPDARARFATDLFARAADDSGLREPAVELLRALFEDPEPEARGIAAAGLVVAHSVDRRNGRRPPRVSEDEARAAYPVARATGHSVGGAAEELGLVSPPPPDGPAPGSTPRAR
ncbi:MAG: hypothetical protein KF878_04910 [Planctomycetes bacterium]|nr:hypothetical protein [Planctomycetota bacterium]